MFVLVVGGGKVGYYLTKELIETGHEVVLMEKDRARAAQIADELGSIVVAQDGCEGKYLGEAGSNRADIVAAVTGDDEDNLVICQMAKHHFDVPRTIARVNNPKNEELFRHLGVDEIISPTRMVLGSIEQDIPVHELLHLAALGERPRDHRGPAPGGLAGGRPDDRRRQLAIPRVARCSRSSATASRSPLRSDTILREGDKVIAIGKAECENDAPRSAHRRVRPDGSVRRLRARRRHWRGQGDDGQGRLRRRARGRRASRRKEPPQQDQTITTTMTPMISVRCCRSAPAGGVVDDDGSTHQATTSGCVMSAASCPTVGDGKRHEAAAPHSRVPGHRVARRTLAPMKNNRSSTLDNIAVRFLGFAMSFRASTATRQRPVYVISVAASILSVHPRTLRIYEEEGLVCPARTPTNIRLYSENDVRRVMWIRHLTQNLGVNLAGVRILFELEERLGTRILERLYTEAETDRDASRVAAGERAAAASAAKS